MNGSMNGGWPPGMPHQGAMQSSQQSSPQQQPQQPAVHICFSASLSCSGINPCDLCAKALKENVLANALTAEHLALGQELEAASQQQRPINPNVLAMAFFQAVAQNWKGLHIAMMQEPPQQRPFQITNVSMLIEAAESWIKHLHALRAQQASAANSAPQTAPPMTPQQTAPGAPAQQPSMASMQTPMAPVQTPSAPAVLVPKVAIGAADYQKVIEQTTPEPVIDVPPGDGAPTMNGTHVTPNDFLVAAPPVDNT